MQYQYVAYIFGFGWVMGIVYDVYNTVTSASKWLRWLRPVLDLSFWCLSAVSVYYVSFITDSGRFRIYTFALLLIGYMVYRTLLHHRVVSSAFTIMRMIRNVIRAVASLVTVVVIRPIGWLLQLTAALVRPLYRLLCTVEDLLFAVTVFWLKVLTFPLRPMWKYFGADAFEKFSNKWEGMWIRVSKWLKNWPQDDS